MKRILTLLLSCLVLTGCHQWTGITTTQLAKKMGGPPQRIQSSGEYRVFVYRDPMGGGQLRFFVDQQGIVRKWTGSPLADGVGGDAVDAPAGDVGGGTVQ
jgi:hypothetical protein